jgi:hypothetical protein
MGHLVGRPRVDGEALRRAMVYGSATGSFAVEAFSVDRFKELTARDVWQRVEEFREMTFFEHDVDDDHG